MKKYTVQNLIAYAKKELNSDEFPESDEEILRIILDLLKIQRHELGLFVEHDLSEQQYHIFKDMIQERKQGKPLAYILGYTYFYYDKFPVSPETLIPRYDTEILVESVKNYYTQDQQFSLLDIGTGTGAIALSLARLFPQVDIKAIDIVEQPFLNSQKALNLEEERIRFKKQNFLQKELWESLGEVDCIVSNPPYLNQYDMDCLEKQVKDFEPHTALYANNEGLIFYEYIAEFAHKFLKLNGTIFLEIDYKHQKVSKFFSEKQFSERKIINDLSGLPRVLMLKKSLL